MRPETKLALGYLIGTLAYTVVLSAFGWWVSRER